MHITAESLAMQARRLAAIILVSAACMPACRADFDTAYTAYLAGNRGALVDDLQAIVASRRADEFEGWRQAMMQRLPPFTRSVAREDAQKVLQLLASGLHQARQAESLMKLVPLMYLLELKDDVYKTFELAAQLEHLPAIIEQSREAGRRGDLATALALEEKAATLGDVQAIYHTVCAYIGDIDADGRRDKYRLPGGEAGVYFACAHRHKIPNEKKAFEWIRRAALAQYGSETGPGLGWFYFRGIGTSVDLEKAFQAFMQSARHLLPDLPRGGSVCLGSTAVALEEMFRLGLGTEKNERYAEYFKSRAICPPLPPTLAK